MIPELATIEDTEAMAALATLTGVEGWSPASIADLVTGPLGRAWVVRTRGVVVAFLLARIVADEAELLLVAVRPEQRRRGLGRALLDALDAEGRAAGVASTFLEVAAGNAGAIALYRARGYVEVGRRPNYYGANNDAVLMRR